MQRFVARCLHVAVLVAYCMKKIEFLVITIEVAVIDSLGTRIVVCSCLIAGDAKDRLLYFPLLDPHIVALCVSFWEVLCLECHENVKGVDITAKIKRK